MTCDLFYYLITFVDIDTIKNLISTCKDINYKCKSNPMIKSLVLHRYHTTRLLEMHIRLYKQMSREIYQV